MPVSLIEPLHLNLLLASSRRSVCVLDARPLAYYRQAHIPGAVPINWEDWCEQAPKDAGAALHQPGYWGILSTADELALGKRLADAGLSHDSTIVVYGGGAASKGREGRIAWMLAYWGALDVRLLNGGLQSWVEAGLPVSDELDMRPTDEHSSPKQFKVQIQHHRRIKLPQLTALARSGGMPAMLDTRSEREFVGLDYRYMPRMGRIPDSQLIEHASIFERDGRFLPRDAYLKTLPKSVTDSDSVVAYCEVGVRACNVALLFELYTGHVMPVYDGSMMEWGTDRSLPVETVKR